MDWLNSYLKGFQNADNSTVPTKISSSPPKPTSELAQKNDKFSLTSSLDEEEIISENVKEFVRNLCEHPETFTQFPLQSLDDETPGAVSPKSSSTLSC
jgi:hypothetical protein